MSQFSLTFARNQKFQNWIAKVAKIELTNVGIFCEYIQITQSRIHGVRIP